MVEVRDRTKESFQRLITAELPALYWLARRLVRDGAEDLVQEALLRAYRSFGTLRQDTAAGPWLKCILVNVFRDQSAPPGPVGGGAAGGPGGGLLAVSDPGRAGPAALFRDLARRLPAGVRQRGRARGAPAPAGDLPGPVGGLRYMDGFATKEIARLLDVPLGTVLARLHRGRKQFERELWAYAQETWSGR